MKQFCMYFEDALKEKFKLPFLVYALGKKRQTYFVFDNSFLSYKNYKQILTFIFDEWYKRKDLNDRLYFLDYMVHNLQKKMNQKNNDDELDLIFGEFLNVIKYSYSPQFYHRRVTESKNKSIHFVNSFKMKKNN